jgi:hypothetical protein
MTIDGVIPVGMEPPPLHPPERKTQAATSGRSKAKKAAAIRGRFHIINAFVDATMGKLTPTERAVWLILWRDTKPNGLAKTSQASIARRAGVSDRWVRKALRHLRQERLVSLVSQGSLRCGSSSYRVFPLVCEH